IEGNPCGDGVAHFVEDCLTTDYEVRIQLPQCGLDDVRSEVCSGTLISAHGGFNAGNYDSLDEASGPQLNAWVNAVESAAADGIVNCQSLADVGDAALVEADFDSQWGRNQIRAYWLAVCDFWTPETGGPVLDDVGFVE